MLTPLWGEDNLLFISSAYDSGSRVLHLSQKDGKTSVREKWFNRKMQIHHGTAVRIDDMIFGSSGDFGPAFLKAVNVKTGKITIQQARICQSEFRCSWSPVDSAG